MSLKPVTALALSAIVSFASFTASSAVAAPNSSDSTVTAPASSVKGAHHGKKDSKKVAPKKKASLPLHSAEPKESPKPAASLSTHLDLKKTSDKHPIAPKKAAVLAGGKEIAIGNKPGHAPAAKGAGDKLDPPVAPGKASGKVALGPLHGGVHGAMAKSGRAPSRPDRAAAKTDDSDQSLDDHPVRVSLRTGAKVAPKAPCMHDAIEFVRGAETESFPVTQCDGANAPLATERLSVLVRPDDAARPASIPELARVEGPQIAPGVRRIDPGLLSRLQTITDHFAKPGLPARVSIVSGYRPGSKGSFHASAQALDFHLDGVPNEALVEFCKTLDNTGCGYYPNSSFVHVDVRPQGTGHVAWIDTSGPGETPHYVASWPVATEGREVPSDVDVKVADKDETPRGGKLPELPSQISVKIDEKSHAATISVPLRLKDWE